MGWTVTFAPVLPWVAIAALTVLGVLLVGTMAYARTRGIWLRTLALGFLVAALANPSVRNE